MTCDTATSCIEELGNGFDTDPFIDARGKATSIPRHAGCRSPFISEPAILIFVHPESTAEQLSEQGLDLLAAGRPGDAAETFRAAIAAHEHCNEAHHGLVRALRDDGRLEEAIRAALTLTLLTPNDPLAHTALSISLQVAGHIPQAEAAAARARILEWKQQLSAPPSCEPDLR
jgi:thioredoxin-like negative regulator of GroEL